jgi:mannose-6-phosphate isomerase-like protein (cupin superfamily)
MIKRATISDKDKAIMDAASLLPMSVRQDNVEYEDFIIKKPWGFEYLLFYNQHVAGWVLHINEGSQTSMHCHPRKKSSLIVLRGRALFSTHNGAHEFNEGEGVLIGKGVFHSTKAVSAGGLVVLEIESPPDKNDLYRFDDAYGREFKGYEGREFYSRMGTGEYKNISALYNFRNHYGEERPVGSYNLSVHRFGEFKRSGAADLPGDAIIGILTDDSLNLDACGKVECGDIVRLEHLLPAAEFLSGDCEILLIKK